MGTPVTHRDDLATTLASLGIESGDHVIVHSALSSLGHMRGGPRAVCEVLMDLVTPDGVVMMPSFNHRDVFASGEARYYSPLESRTTNGIVPDTFWRMEDVYRSLNPTHAFAAWGHDAESLVADHHRTLTMGWGSPLHRLEERGGKAIFIDCLHANTHHHVVETTNDVPCLGKRTLEYPVKLPSGEMVRCRTWSFRERECPVTDDGAYLDVLRDRGLLAKRELANAAVSVLELSDSRAVVEDCLFGDVPGVDGCQPCDVDPQTNDATVDGDWDDDAQRVVRSTAAFVGDWDCASTSRRGPERE